jgi:bifunctional UDP-N-acetylglucosamine pyrophosphorylase/glucosamine-1-phosphate N-acetyltransferase
VREVGSPGEGTLVAANTMPRVSAPTVVILAAGQGTRMKSAKPKVLHEVCGRPMVLWPVAAARAAGAEKVVVVGGPDGALEPVLDGAATLAVQPESDGTGGAMRAAMGEIGGARTVVVLYGDAPLVTPALVEEIVAAHDGSGAAATIVTTELEDPSGYGRVVRGAGGDVERVVETKSPGDATDEEMRIREVNTGIYVFSGAPLADALERIGNDNAQGEYYLPDVVPALIAAGETVAAHAVEDPSPIHGVNDRVDLARVTALARRRILEDHMRAGVTFADPANTLVDADVAIGRDTLIEPGCALRGSTRIGERCVIGPASTLIDSVLHDEVTVLHSYLLECEVLSGGRLGPFAYLRPGALLREGAKAGTFVEIKNSDIGAGTKIPHLSYIGDADVGPNSNLGAGTITANYDGKAKHRTTIGANVRGGVDTAFVAPVKVGDNAWTAAGSVITEDVPDDALAVARERQRNIEGYGSRKDGE